MRGFGELEAEIMDAVWDADESLTVRNILERIDHERTPAYTTVQTVTEILYRKGWLQRHKDGRAWRYRATHSREEYTAGLVEEVLSSTPDRTATLVRLVEQMDPDEVSELQAALDAAKNAEDRS
ncbi:putative transcriptional regulator [Saccharopolyspora lacisalsi]|uniref:Putative transcriptional regulator n=1 Tax=Halosaccharopolyspora lacisalsi TaxID=1000566 RepID=A0A839DXE4_9PSEU|nr:BlaI/MecI/CopY family transcriptional regulator [Halosaccharopolyspora lacisalsi]MBA8824117.1 putative transcriptional regulator [Halosaccharopolyspora lacisalsi]